MREADDEVLPLLDFAAQEQAAENRGQGDGENQGSISSIFGPDHRLVRRPGATVSVWCIFCALRHRSFYYCIFYFITNHKIASENSIFEGYFIVSFDIWGDTT